jgi:ubiquinone biosynthesis protein
MRLRPELVLLQKTMVTVEGVARRIDPDNDIWAAAEPVVARWIARELSPASRLRDFARDAHAAVTALARMAEPDAAATPHSPPPVAPASSTPDPTHPAIWFLAGAAVSALTFLSAVLLRMLVAR